MKKPRHKYKSQKNNNRSERQRWPVSNAFSSTRVFTRHNNTNRQPEGAVTRCSPERALLLRRQNAGGTAGSVIDLCSPPAGTLHHVLPQRQREQVRPPGEVLLRHRPLVEELPKRHGRRQGNGYGVRERTHFRDTVMRIEGNIHHDLKY